MTKPPCSTKYDQANLLRFVQKYYDQGDKIETKKSDMATKR